jgi:hypothetical protein
MESGRALGPDSINSTAGVSADRSAVVLLDWNGGGSVFI